MQIVMAGSLPGLQRPPKSQRHFQERFPAREAASQRHHPFHLASSFFVCQKTEGKPPLSREGILGGGNVVTYRRGNPERMMRVAQDVTHVWQQLADTSASSVS